MLIQNFYAPPLEMDYYQTNGDCSYPALHEMMNVDMDLSNDINAYHHHQHDLNKHHSSSHLSQDSYDHITQNAQLGYTADSQMQVKFPHIALPHKLTELDVHVPVSSLNWLQPVNNGMQHQDGSCSSALLMNPSSPINNGNHSVQNQSLSSKVLSLPNNVQISGGSVNYVSMPSGTQQVYITTSKPSMTTHQQPPAPEAYRPRSDSNYMLSPNSVPSSTVVDNPFPKPPYSYSCLIAMALKNSKNGSLPVAEIYNFMIRHFPYFKTAPDGWKNSVRHNLSLNKCFEKIENPNADGTNSRKGCLWALNHAKIKKMDEEIFKWNKKDPMAIKRAMARPEILDMLSKGQESYLAANGVKSVTAGHGRQAGHHQPLHQPLHHMHQQHSPHHSPPNNGILNNGTPSMMAHNSPGAMPVQPHAMHNHMHDGRQQEQNKLQQLMDESSGLFDSNGELTLDPALSEINIQSGMWDDLPQDFLDIPFSHSPTTFLISPKKSSPAVSPAQSTEIPVIPNNMSRGTLIPLGQN